VQLGARIELYKEMEEMGVGQATLKWNSYISIKIFKLFQGLELWAILKT
tara:strand:+ start:9855 stop:10001 length:147 start_codon:yes stop_codon:yes gene_type:complete